MVLVDHIPYSKIPDWSSPLSGLSTRVRGFPLPAGRSPGGIVGTVACSSMATFGPRRESMPIEPRARHSAHNRSRLPCREPSGHDHAERDSRIRVPRRVGASAVASIPPRVSWNWSKPVAQDHIPYSGRSYSLVNTYLVTYPYGLVTYCRVRVGPGAASR